MKPIRVIQVITRMVQGGARRVVLQLLQGLPKAEYDQTLICGSAEGPVPVPYEVIPDLVREVRPRRDLRAALRLARLFIRRRPHVVHAHTYKAGVLASVAARLAGVPSVVFTPHGHIFARGARIPGVPDRGWKHVVLRWVTRAAQACAHRVTALSETDLRQQLELGLSPFSKYQVIRNGIDIDRFDAPPPPAAGLVVGAVGRFTSEKGHVHLLEAFKQVLARRADARLVLVGFGELEPELRRRAADLSLNGAVTFAGERESAEMLPAFHIFVQPSLYESQGLAILEAMAAGRPVVATDVGGVRDVVRHGETGLLVPPADPEELADAILRLAGDPRLAADLAARARARVRELFPVRRMVDDYARLYKELLGPSEGKA